MRRIGPGCSSETHLLYGTFMSCLSKCLFEWDEADYQLLAKAKRGELIRAGVTNPSESAIWKATTKLELARHCRRRTRGSTESAKLIETLLLSLSVATDSLGVRLFRKDMMEVWAVLKCHLPCLQDPPNVSLYTSVGYITKGGEHLPMLRCARGTNSLESFHLHLAR